MTLDEFFDRLAAKRAEDNNQPFHKFYGGCLRTDVRRDRYTWPKSMCPIEYVAGMELAYSQAGPALGLSYTDVHEIATAADNLGPDPFIRARLLKACGLD